MVFDGNNVTLDYIMKQESSQIHFSFIQITRSPYKCSKTNFISANIYSYIEAKNVKGWLNCCIAERRPIKTGNFKYMYNDVCNCNHSNLPEKSTAHTPLSW